MFDQEVLRAYFVTGVRDFHTEKNFTPGNQAYCMGDCNMMRLLRTKINRRSIRSTSHTSPVLTVPDVLHGAVNLLLDIDGFGTSVEMATSSLLDQGLISVDVYRQKPDSGEERQWIVWALSAAMIVHLGLSRTFEHIGPASSFFGTVASPLNWALFTALFVGEIATVRKLLDREPCLKRGSELFRNLLQMAARIGSEEALLLLLERGADVNGVGDISAPVRRNAFYHLSQGTSLEVACFAGHKRIVDILFEPKYRLETTGHAYVTAVWNASGNGPIGFRSIWDDSRPRPHVDILRLLLDRGQFNFYFASVKDHILSRACSWGHGDVVRLLLKVGVHHVHPTYEWLRDAYRFAVEWSFVTERDSTEIFRILLDFDLNQQVPEGANDQPRNRRSVLCAAIDKGYEEIVRMLYHCDACIYRGRDRTPESFVAAARGGHVHLMKFFMSTGLDLRSQQCGICALKSAAADGHEAVVQYLFELQVNTLELPFNDQPIRLAIREGHQGVVDKLNEFRHLTHTTSG